MAVAESSITTSPIDTKNVAGRRQVRYDSLDDLLADAERLAQAPHRTLGNWSYGAILKHLAAALTMGIDGGVPPAPWPVRFFARTILKRRFLRGPMPPGFKLPRPAAAVLIPEATTSDEEGLVAIRAAVARWKNETRRQPHPAFGKLADWEWNRLQCRHAELHMSFVVPHT
jgi:hypothetical protein